MYNFQEDAADALFNEVNRQDALGLPTDGVIVLPTSSGKCLARGTKVLLHNGTEKAVEEILVGDKLIGPDGKPRKVLSLCQGKEKLYEVTPVHGNPWVCNASHLLVFDRQGQRGKGSKRYIMSVEELASRAKHFRKFCKEVCFSGYERREQSVLLDPYFVGLWLADGNKSPIKAAISKPDADVKDFMEHFAASQGLRLRRSVCRPGDCPTFFIRAGAEGNDRDRNHVLHHLRTLFADSLAIPESYINNSRRVRMELLAGFLDGDGYTRGRGCYEVIQKRTDVADSLCRLVVSLGGKVRRRVKHVNGAAYQRMTIYLPEVPPHRIARKRPTQLSPVAAGFSVRPLRLGTYFGFELDGDHQFVLASGTVTHNTILGMFIAYHASERTLVVVPTQEIEAAWREDLQRVFGFTEKEIGCIRAKTLKIGEHFTIGSMQTLMKLPEKEWANKFGLLITDELHRLAALEFNKVAQRCTANIRIGLTATDNRKDGLMPMIRWHIGENIYKDLTPRNSVPLVYCGVKLPLSVEPTVMDGYDVEYEWNDTLTKLCESDEYNDAIVATIQHIRQEYSGAVLVSSCRLDHLSVLAGKLSSCGSPAVMLTGQTKNRKRLFAEIKQGLHPITLATQQIVAEGASCPAWHHVVIGTPFSDPKTMEQLKGRPIRLDVNKKFGYVWDFCPQVKMLENMFRTRYKAIKPHMHKAVFYQLIRGTLKEVI
jgi:superfamily II DNA or RNA helicase